MTEDSKTTHQQAFSWKMISMYFSWKIIGIYCAVAWGCIEFTQWLSERFGVTPLFQDIALMLFVLLLPTIIVINKLTSKPIPLKTKIFLTGNCSIALISALIYFFSQYTITPKPAIAPMVLENHSESATLKGAKYIRYATLFFDTNESELKWASTALPFLIQFDLSQDSLLHASNIRNYNLELSEFLEARRVPLLKALSVLEQQGIEYYLTGDIAQIDEKIRANVSLYKVKTGKAIYTRKISANDIFTLTDKITSAFKKQLDLPDGYLEETKDYTVKAMLTESEEAFRSLIDGMDAMSLNLRQKDYAKHLKQAVAHDDSFAYAKYLLVQLYAGENKLSEGLKVLESINDDLYRLPKPMQFNAASLAAGLRLEYEKQKEIISQWSKVLPYDMTPKIQLASYQELEMNYSNAVEQFEQLYRLDSDNLNYLLKLGQLNFKLQKNTLAKAYLKKYILAQPEVSTGYTNLASILISEGALDKAQEQIELALIYNPDDLTLNLFRANMAFRQGDIETCFNTLQTYHSESAVKQLSAKLAQINYLSILGQNQLAIQQFESIEKEISTYITDDSWALRKARLMHMYTITQDKPRVEQWFKTIKTSTAYTNEKFFRLAIDYYYIWQLIKGKDLTTASQDLKKLLVEIADLSPDWIKNLRYTQAYIAIKQQHKAEAKKLTNQFVILFPNTDEALELQAKLAKLENRVKKSIAYYNALLQRNYSQADIHIELATLLKDETLAQEHLKSAKRLLQKADPNTESLAKLKQTEEQLKQG